MNKNNLSKKINNLTLEIKATQFFINMFGHPFRIYGITPMHICYDKYKKLDELTSEKNKLINQLNQYSNNKNEN